MVFIAAEPREFAGLLPYCKSVEKLDWPVAWARVAELKGHRIFLAANGAGPRCAAEAVEVAGTEERDGVMESLVSTGFCGGLDPNLKVGDVFVATSIQVDEQVSAVRAPESARRCFKGTLVSQDRVAQTMEEKRYLSRSGALAVEMEAAGLLSRVREWGMPFYCIRSVTDTAGESFQIDLNSVRLADGRFSTPRILAAAMRRPSTALPELLELRRRCMTAARSLGEFIADCSF